ncbi:MAG TPA: 50S ribosomal protein L9 [Beutenbergiaceae bacterium]|nr:50S ribosomal protein L9 [Beutenbergiaceae bacterium]
MATKIILTHDVTGLGAAGEVVEVKPGYARNYLLPRGLATPWTKGAQRQIDQMAAARRRREISTIEDASVVRDQLADITAVVTVNASDSGRLFGAVKTADIAEAVHTAGGPQLDRRKIEITSPIKSLGDHQVSVRLHESVTATINVEVVPAT